MKKIFLFFVLSITFVFANINQEILLIESKLYPKIMELTENLQNKKIIKIAIIADSQSWNEAQTLKNFLNKKNFKIDIIKKPDLKHDVYILTQPLKKAELEKLLSNKKIIFSSIPNYVETAMFSIYIGAKVYPYINPYLIKKSGIKIDSIIFKVGKIYEK